MLENFFKKSRFRRSRRARGSFRSSIRRDPPTTRPTHSPSPHRNNTHSVVKASTLTTGYSEKTNNSMSVLANMEARLNSTAKSSLTDVKKQNMSYTPSIKLTNGNLTRISRPRSDNRTDYAYQQNGCNNNDAFKIQTDQSDYSDLNVPCYASAANRSALSAINRSMGLSADQLRFDLMGQIEGEPLKRGENKIVEILRAEVTRLRKELLRQREVTIAIKIRENQLQERLCEQAKRQLERASTKFEDLSLGSNRPTQLVRRYSNLYSEARVDAMDGLDLLAELSREEDLKIKLLLSILVLSFRSAQKVLLETRTRVRDLLQVNHVMRCTTCPQTERLVREMEEDISLYMRKTIDKQDLTKISHDVSERVYTTLYDYPILRQCSALSAYINECVGVAWALTLQNPPISIDYECKVYNVDRHNRFHTSDPDSDVIKTVMWPTLVEGEKDVCLSKGIVIT